MMHLDVRTFAHDAVGVFSEMLQLACEGRLTWARAAERDAWAYLAAYLAAVLVGVTAATKK